MKKLSCKTCRWFDPEHESIKLVPLIPGKYAIGFCRKHFPVVYLVNNRYYGAWPAVDVGDFCGEHRDKDSE